MAARSDAAVFTAPWRSTTLSGRARGSRLRQHTLDGHRLATLPLALVGRFHEGVDLDRLLKAHGRLARLEELADLHDERLIAAGARGELDALRAEHERPVVFLARAQSAEG